MQTSNSIDQLRAKLLSSPADYSLIIPYGSLSGNISSVEFSSLSGAKEYTSRESIFVSTNLFKNDTWGDNAYIDDITTKKYNEDSSYLDKITDCIRARWLDITSKTFCIWRSENLLFKINESKEDDGYLDEREVKNTLDAKMFFEGGVTHPCTIYQIIMHDSENKTMCIKRTQLEEDWQCLDLRKLLNSNAEEANILYRKIDAPLYPDSDSYFDL